MALFTLTLPKAWSADGVSTVRIGINFSSGLPANSRQGRAIREAEASLRNFLSKSCLI